MSVQRQKDVVQFQVAVNDSVLVEILQGQAYFGGVELGSLQAELSPLDVQHEIATRDVFHDKVDASLGLETGVEIQEKRMSLLVGDEKYALLRLGRLHFIILNDELFLQHLDGVQLLGRLRLGEHHLAKVAFTKHSQEVEVVQANSPSAVMWWMMCVCREPERLLCSARLMMMMMMMMMMMRMW